MTKRPSAVEWLRRLNNGDISAVELVETTLSRIQAVNSDLNALIAQDPAQSIKQAQQADKLRSDGQQLPLLGLPITVKDSIDAEGFICTGGSHARADFMPPQDSTVVARLKAAGAIIIGKTNLPEYSSSYETHNAIFGRTNNPADLERTPGGSTGGEGALLGADATIVSVGLDGGGSIRVPSHYCGVVGIRPTVGRVPDTGHWPVTRDTGYRDLMTIGPMGRYVEDLSLLLSIMDGPDWHDPYSVPVPLGDPNSVDVSKLNIAYYDDDSVAQVSDETREALANAARALQDVGATVTKINAPDTKDATAVFFAMAGADGGVRTRRDIEGAGGQHHEQFQGLIDSFGESMSLVDFFDVQDQFFKFRARIRQFLTNYDAVLCPVTTGPAPKHMEAPFGIPQDEYLNYAAFNYLHTYAVAGVPVAVVPTGSQSGMPLGVQIVSQAYQDHVPLAVAASLESSLGGYQPQISGLSQQSGS